jgi:hypothetical protein
MKISEVSSHQLFVNLSMLVLSMTAHNLFLAYVEVTGGNFQEESHTTHRKQCKSSSLYFNLKNMALN